MMIYNWAVTQPCCYKGALRSTNSGVCPAEKIGRLSTCLDWSSLFDHNVLLGLDLKGPALYNLPASQWLMSFNVAFIIILFFVYLGFLAGANTYYTEIWLQLVICE